MRVASILVATAGVGLAGYALQSQFGIHESGPVAEVVTLPQQRTSEPAVAVRTPAASEPQKATATPGDRGSLTRALQRELQRVGCYDGEINGAWTTSSRMAMKAFTDRVNASLPIDSPDYILLSLLQRHEGKACGTNCPGGQSLSEEGRCVPSAVLAKAAVKPAAPAEAKAADKAPVASAITSWSPTAGSAPDARSLPIRGNAALAGPGEAVPKPGPAETRQERPRIAAAEPDMEPAVQERRSNRRSARSDEPAADAGVYEERPRHKVRRAKSKPPKIVRKFLRSMQRSFAGLPW